MRMKLFETGSATKTSKVSIDIYLPKENGMRYLRFVGEIDQR